MAQHCKCSFLYSIIYITTELVTSCRCYSGNRIAVRFEYEYHDDTGKWFRAHGNEVRPPIPQLMCVTILMYAARAHSNVKIEEFSAYLPNS